MDVIDCTTFPVPFKRCSHGEHCVHPMGPYLPATSEYFHRNASLRDGWCVECKHCKSAMHNHIPRPVYKVPDGYKRCSCCGEIKMASPANFGIDKTTKSGFRPSCRVCERIRGRHYGRINREKIREKRLRSRGKYKYVARKKDPAKRRIQDRRRDAKRRLLPATFTNKDWRYALIYFHGTCAYCGNGPSLFDTNYVLHQEHFIPQSKNGGYTPNNILPACQQCNLSKGDSDARDWIKAKFGARKAVIILKRITSYFATLTE